MSSFLSTNPLIGKWIRFFHDSKKVPPKFHPPFFVLSKKDHPHISCSYYLIKPSGKLYIYETSLNSINGNPLPANTKIIIIPKDLFIIYKRTISDLSALYKKAENILISLTGNRIITMGVDFDNFDNALTIDALWKKYS